MNMIATPEAVLPHDAVDAQTWWEIQQFLHYEADLLDERQFEAWLELLDEDIHYWMPLVRNVRRDAKGDEYSGPRDVAWFDEGIVTLRQRVAQIKTGLHWAEEPASRVSHLVTNVRVVSFTPGPDGDAAVVRSRCLVHQNRNQTETRMFVCKRIDTLRRRGGAWKILAREIHLDQNVLLAKALTTFF